MKYIDKIPVFTGMTMNKIKKLPDTPGVYIFFNSQKEIIYVGKASSLKSRVGGYFKRIDSRFRGNDSVSYNGGNDNVRQNDNRRPIEEMIHEVVDLKTEQTDSALEAAILEGYYIKKYRPKYNIQWRDDKSWNWIGISKDVYPRVLTIRQHELTEQKKKEFKYLFGPYPGLNTKEAMNILRKLFYISSCQPKGSFATAQDDRGRDSSVSLHYTRNDKRNEKMKPCFYYQLGQCLGVCTGEISAKDYVAKVIRPLCLFLGGKKKLLMKKIEKEMGVDSRLQNFEEAARLRNQLYHLQKIQDVALLNESFVMDKVKGDSNFHGNDTTAGMTNKGIASPAVWRARNDMRIEGYDISNLGSSDKVGSMVVFDESESIKSQYRKFKIKTVTGQSDVDCLAEVLERRLKHSEWPMPNLFLIDGGLPQVNKAKTVLREAGVNTPIVGIAKGIERKRNDFFVVAELSEVKKWIKENKNLLIQVRDEAHRFAIAFNRAQRKIKY